MSKEKEIVEEKDVKKNDTKEEHNEFKRIGEAIFNRLREYKFLILLEVIVFVLLFLLIPRFIFEVHPYIWWTLFVIFTIVPTVIFYKKETFKRLQIIVALPVMYLLILTVLRSAILMELYGISSRGNLDPTPVWIDVLFVAIIIVFFQYIGIIAVDLINKRKEKKKKK